MDDDLDPLAYVGIVSACCITTVLILGAWYDAITYEKKVLTVPCSVNINDMARKLNVTLIGRCEVDDET